MVDKRKLHSDLQLNSEAENAVNSMTNKKMEDNEFGRSSSVRDMRPEWSAWGVDAQSHFSEQESINQWNEDKMNKDI